MVELSQIPSLGSLAQCDPIRSPLLQLPAVGQQVTSPLTGNTYTVGQPIGEGSFGVVFGCSDVWENLLVAKVLKRVDEDFSVSEQKALRELNALAHVRHPNIVQVYDAFVYQGGCYIISERCGRTLHEVVTSKNFRPSIWIRAIARCLLQAVHFVHVQGLAHCDIHLKNAFIRFIADELLPSEQSAVTFKLGDFGLARTLDAVDPTGTFLESIRPPEAIDPDEFGVVDHRVDIYQVGLLLLQVLRSDVNPFSRKQILDGVPGRLARDLPAPYSCAIERMVRRHVSFRTPTALDAWRDVSNTGNLT